MRNMGRKATEERKTGLQKLSRALVTCYLLGVMLPLSPHKSTFSCSTPLIFSLLHTHLHPITLALLKQTPPLLPQQLVVQQPRGMRESLSLVSECQRTLTAAARSSDRHYADLLAPSLHAPLQTAAVCCKPSCGKHRNYQPWWLLTRLSRLTSFALNSARSWFVETLWPSLKFSHWLCFKKRKHEPSFFALTGYCKCADACTLFAGISRMSVCAEADMQRDCFTACGLTVLPSSTALLPSICPLWHCAFSLLSVSIWALHPADTHWKSLTLFTASALWNVYPFVQPWLSIGEKTKQKQRLIVWDVKRGLPDKCPWFRLAPLLVYLRVSWWCSSLSSASP